MRFFACSRGAVQLSLRALARDLGDFLPGSADLPAGPRAPRLPTRPAGPVKPAAPAGRVAPASRLSRRRSFPSRLPQALKILEVAGAPRLFLQGDQILIPGDLHQDPIQVHLDGSRRKHLPQFALPLPLHQVEAAQLRLQNPIAALRESLGVEGIGQPARFESAAPSSSAFSERNRPANRSRFCREGAGTTSRSFVART